MASAVSGFLSAVLPRAGVGVSRRTGVSAGVAFDHRCRSLLAEFDNFVENRVEIPCPTSSRLSGETNVAKAVEW